MSAPVPGPRRRLPGLHIGCRCKGAGSAQRRIELWCWTGLCNRPAANGRDFRVGQRSVSATFVRRPGLARGHDPDWKCARSGGRTQSDFRSWVARPVRRPDFGGARRVDGQKSPRGARGVAGTSKGCRPPAGPTDWGRVDNAPQRGRRRCCMLDLARDFCGGCAFCARALFAKRAGGANCATFNPAPSPPYGVRLPSNGHGGAGNRAAPTYNKPECRRASAGRRHARASFRQAGVRLPVGLVLPVQEIERDARGQGEATRRGPAYGEDAT